jgi:hypothetical protein
MVWIPIVRSVALRPVLLATPLLCHPLAFRLEGWLSPIQNI